MSKEYVNEYFLFLTLLKNGLNSFSFIKKRMFFINSKNIAKILFELQCSHIVSIHKDGVYLTMNMYIAIQYIDTLEKEVLDRKKIELKELIADSLESKYKKSFKNELECLIQYV